MEVLFYLFGLIAIMSSISVVFNVHPVYALLSLIIYCLSFSCIFFILGAYLAGVLEVIIYAGAVMVLFSFVVMMLNVNDSELRGESLVVQCSLRQLFLMLSFFIVILYIICTGSNNFYIRNIYQETISLKSIGISLFGDYIFVVETASILLLVALVISIRIAKGFS